jgi:hypothetical protein
MTHLKEWGDDPTGTWNPTGTNVPAGTPPEPGRNSAKNGTSFAGDLTGSQIRTGTTAGTDVVEATNRAAGDSERPLFSESLVHPHLPLPPLRPLPPRFLPPPPPLPFWEDEPAPFDEGHSKLRWLPLHVLHTCRRP